MIENESLQYVEELMNKTSENAKTGKAMETIRQQAQTIESN